jgi:hypothetical protein
MKILIILPVFLLTSCSSYVRTLGTRMISPETSKGFGNGTLDVRLQSSKRDRLNFDNDKVNNKIENSDSPYAVSALGEMGIVKRVDAFIIPSMYLTPTLWGAKVQVLGDEQPDAKKGNFSTSLMGAVGSKSESYSSSGDLNDILFGNIDKLEVNTTHREVGLISGYRWTDRFLHYANAIFFHEKVDGKVTTNNNNLMDSKFKYTQEGQIFSTGFILYFGAHANWKVDYSHFLSDWSKTGKQTINTVNTAIGFNW